MTFRNKCVSVIGLGRSGTSAIKVLSNLGAYIKASDISKNCKVMLPDRIDLELGKHTIEFIFPCDLLVVSPGVRLPLHILNEAKRRNVAIISELELGYQLLKYFDINHYLIAITGTNGKTSTTTFVHNILQAAGLPTIAAGNIGKPLTEAVFEQRYTTQKVYFVIEVSSFQLSHVVNFCADINVILNIAEDHLDYHKNFNEYVQTKLKLLSNQTHNSWAIVNANLRPLISHFHNNKFLYFSAYNEVICNGAYLDGDKAIINFNGRKYEISLSDFKIQGRHNIENFLASALVASILEVVESIPQVIPELISPPHRLEYVRTISGVRFINDSKATNPHAVCAALSTFEGNVIVLLGGEDKNLDFSPLKPILEKHAKAVVLFGQARRKIQTKIANFKPIYTANRLDEAVKKAWSISKCGDTILLSPGCASFDEFTDYAHRGEIFKEIVNSIC